MLGFYSRLLFLDCHLQILQYHFQAVLIDSASFMYGQNREVGDKFFSDELVGFGRQGKTCMVEVQSEMDPSYDPIFKGYLNSYTVTVWATELALSSFSLILKKIS